MNESRRFRTNTPTKTQVNHLLRGNRGVRAGGGAPRPSGAGSTRQPVPVGSGGGGGVAEADSGAGRLMLHIPADRLVRHGLSVPVGPDPERLTPSRQDAGSVAATPRDATARRQPRDPS